VQLELPPFHRLLVLARTSILSKWRALVASFLFLRVLHPEPPTASSSQLPNMPKRTRTGIDTDTNVSEFGEASDGSYCDAPKPRKKTRQTRKVASKRARSKSAKTNIAAQEGQATHPTSLHVVTGVGPIRESLLHWYGQIHEVRRMPWRKAFDGSLDQDGRAQRAYEVRSRGQLIIP